MFAADLSGTGNVDENDGTAWTAGNADLPMLSDDENPKIPRT